MKKVLFVLRNRHSYGVSGPSYGLAVSCEMVCKCLAGKVDTKIVTVIDSNGIDKEISIYQPTHVVIEAIFAPPAKIMELLKLWPKVKFCVRIHSMIPFLAQEGVALHWLKQYKHIAAKNPHFVLVANNEDFIKDLNHSMGYNIQFTPNCYYIENPTIDTRPIGDTLIVGCFGALRALKNQLQQAVCAITVANKLNKSLEFHINDSSTYEVEGKNILNNLQHLFNDTKHKLVIHPWQNHDDFVNTVKTMDVGMQCSFTETFNLVSADFVASGIPLMGSSQIAFLFPQYVANPTNAKDICDKLEFAINHKTSGWHRLNQQSLIKMTEHAVKTWIQFLD